MTILPQITPDVQLWDNRDGTWKVTPISDRASDLFNLQFCVRTFKVELSELLMILLLCASYGLVIDTIRDMALTTMTDLEGNKIDDPKNVKV
jgi:hypothetical protein